MIETLKNLVVDIQFILFPIWRLRKSGAKIGKNVFIGTNVYIELENASFLEIADNVTLSAYIKIILHDSALSNVSGGPILYGKVILKAGCYIGSDTLILPGSVIGENTIVGAGSLVKGVLKSNSVYYGRPARFVSTIGSLEKKWKKRKPDNLTYLKKVRMWNEKVIK